MHKHVAPAAALLAVIALAGCSTSDAAHSEAHVSAPHSTPAASSASLNPDVDPDDVMFAQMMIPHHEQALVMSSIAMSKDGISDGITGIAQRIDEEQFGEIADLTSWLEQSGSPVKSAGHESHEMPGMLTDEQIEQLRAATGDEFEKMWLLFMVAHHQGAVTMSQDVIANGTDPELRAFAERTIANQGMEIDQMTILLSGR